MFPTLFSKEAMHQSTKISKLSEAEIESMLKNMSKYCRLCLVNKGSVDIQNDEWMAKFYKLGIELVSQYKLPSTICQCCETTINTFYLKKEMFDKNQWTLFRIAKTLQKKKDSLKDSKVLQDHSVANMDSAKMDFCNQIYKSILNCKSENIPIVFGTTSCTDNKNEIVEMKPVGTLSLEDLKAVTLIEIKESENELYEEGIVAYNNEKYSDLTKKVNKPLDCILTDWNDEDDIETVDNDQDQEYYLDVPCEYKKEHNVHYNTPEFSEVQHYEEQLSNGHSSKKQLSEVHNFEKQSPYVHNYPQESSEVHSNDQPSSKYFNCEKQSSEVNNYEERSENHNYEEEFPEVDKYEKQSSEIHNFKEQYINVHNHKERSQDHNYEEEFPEVDNCEKQSSEIHNYKEQYIDAHNHEKQSQDHNYEEEFPEVDNYEKQSSVIHNFKEQYMNVHNDEEQSEDHNYEEEFPEVNNFEKQSSEIINYKEQFLNDHNNGEQSQDHNYDEAFPEVDNCEAYPCEDYNYKQESYKVPNYNPNVSQNLQFKPEYGSDGGNIIEGNYCEGKTCENIENESYVVNNPCENVSYNVTCHTGSNSNAYENQNENNLSDNNVGNQLTKNPCLNGVVNEGDHNTINKSKNEYAESGYGSQPSEQYEMEYDCKPFVSQIEYDTQPVTKVDNFMELFSVDCLSAIPKQKKDKNKVVKKEKVIKRKKQDKFSQPFEGFEENECNQGLWKVKAMKTMSALFEQESANNEDIQEKVKSLILPIHRSATSASNVKLSSYRSMEFNKKSIRKKVVNITLLSEEQLEMVSFVDLAKEIKPMLPVDTLDFHKEKEYTNFVLKHGTPKLVLNNEHGSVLNFKLNTYGKVCPTTCVKVNPSNIVSHGEKLGSSDVNQIHVTVGSNATSNLASQDGMGQLPTSSSAQNVVSNVNSILSNEQNLSIGQTDTPIDRNDEIKMRSTKANFNSPTTQILKEVPTCYLTESSLIKSVSPELVDTKKDVKQEIVPMNPPTPIKNLPQFLQSLKKMRALPSELVAEKSDTMKNITTPLESVRSTDDVLEDSAKTIQNLDNSSPTFVSENVENNLLVTNKQRLADQTYAEAHVKKRKLLASTGTEAVLPYMNNSTDNCWMNSSAFEHTTPQQEIDPTSELCDEIYDFAQGKRPSCKRNCTIEQNFPTTSKKSCDKELMCLIIDPNKEDKQGKFLKQAIIEGPLKIRDVKNIPPQVFSNENLSSNQVTESFNRTVLLDENNLNEDVSVPCELVKNVADNIYNSTNTHAIHSNEEVSLKPETDMNANQEKLYDMDKKINKVPVVPKPTKVSFADTRSSPRKIIQVRSLDELKTSSLSEIPLRTNNKNNEVPAVPKPTKVSFTATKSYPKKIIKVRPLDKLKTSSPSGIPPRSNNKVIKATRKVKSRPSKRKITSQNLREGRQEKICKDKILMLINDLSFKRKEPLSSIKSCNVSTSAKESTLEVDSNSTNNEDGLTANGINIDWRSRTKSISARKAVSVLVNESQTKSSLSRFSSLAKVDIPMTESKPAQCTQSPLVTPIKLTPIMNKIINGIKQCPHLTKSSISPNNPPLEISNVKDKLVQPKVNNSEGTPKYLSCNHEKPSNRTTGTKSNNKRNKSQTEIIVLNKKCKKSSSRSKKLANPIPYRHCFPNARSSSRPEENSSNHSQVSLPVRSLVATKESSKSNKRESYDCYQVKFIFDQLISSSKNCGVEDFEVPYRYQMKQ